MSFLKKLFGGDHQGGHKFSTQIDLLRSAIETGDKQLEEKARIEIVSIGPAIGPTLAAVAMEFDPDNIEDDPTEVRFFMARAALGMIGEIGELGFEHAQSIYNHFLKDRALQSANQDNWGGVYRTAGEALQKLQH